MPTVTLKSASIQLLPPQLANQIAAGEVVERPASVVKELIENSIDANADSIHIEIEQGGHKRMLIRDTGGGIPQEELELALSRHATSKIRDIDDLECITSMGFRGEALASISAVSRLTLTSRPADQPQAWQAKAEGLDMAVTLSPAAHPPGTSIEVVDLFFNTPARRKFLRAQKTEFQHIENIVRRVALAHPKVSFSLKHNGKAVFKWNAGDLPSRINAVCGPNFLQQTAPIDYRHQQIHLCGWCSKIGEGWQTNDQQYIFVNHRMVRDKLVLHAIRQAYEGMLADNLHPAYVLFLSLPAEQMDVNVHPAKHEVRFHEARQVHDVIYQAIGQAIVSAQALSEQSPVDVAVVPTITHDYIRPLQTDQTAAASKASVGSPSARMLSVASRSGSARIDARSIDPIHNVNIAEAGKRYQQLMSTNGGLISPLSYVRLGEFLLFQQSEALQVVALSNVISLGFKQEIGQASTSQPLLMPVSVAQSAVSEHSVIEQLEAMGCIVERRHQKYILKQVPSPIRALPWAHIFVRLLEQTEAVNNEAQCIDLIVKYQLEITQASAASIKTAVAKIDTESLQQLLSAFGQSITEKMLLAALELG